MPRARILYGIPSRSYSYRQRYEFGTMDVGIASVPDEEAPLVARARWIDGSHGHKWMEATDYRWHAGHLWQVADFYSRDPGVRDELQTPDSYGFVRALTDRFRNRVPLTPEERDVAADLNPVRVSQRALKKGPDLSDVPTATAFRAVAKEFLFVGDVLHERSVGPILSLRPTSRGRTDDKSVPSRDVAIYRSARAYGCSVETFPSEAHAAIDGIVSNLNLAVAGGVSASSLVSGFEILSPDLLDPRRLEDGVLQETARVALAALGAAKLGDAGDRVIRHVLDIRRAFSAYEERELADGVRAGTYHSGRSWLAERDMAPLRPFVEELVDPALMGRLSPEATLVVSVSLSRMGIVSPFEMDDVALGGISL